LKSDTVPGCMADICRPSGNQLKWFRCESGLPDFSWSKHTKTEKCTKWPTNYTKRLSIIPGGRKIFQMVIKYNSIFYSKALQILPKLAFWVWKQTIWQPWCESGKKHNALECRQKCPCEIIGASVEPVQGDQIGRNSHIGWLFTLGSVFLNLQK
jgi:hypothetical protein